MMKKLNDIKYGGANVPDMIELNQAQLSSLSKDQIEGREPVSIRGVQGYVDGDGVWKSLKYRNKLKKEGKWKGN